MILNFIFLFFVIFNHFTYQKIVLPDYSFDQGRIPFGVLETDAQKYIVERYFIHQDTATCRKFIYLGSGGNWNNFESFHELSFTKSENAASCLSEPAHVGQCNLTMNARPIRYSFYHTAKDGIKKGECKEFKYSGCGGNANNFETIEDCQNACANNINGVEPETGVTTVSVPNIFDCFIQPNADISSSENKIVFVQSQKKCAYAAVSTDQKTRGYFKTFHHCTSTCIKEDEIIEACKASGPYFPPIPNQPDPSLVIKRYYFDSTAKKCLSFESYPLENNIYFDPKLNNFPTLHMCLGYCTASEQPEETTQQDVCSLPLSGSINSGPVLTNAINVYRYYFDKNEKVCKFFKFSGINGNGNNFKSKKLCNFICNPTSKDNDDDHNNAPVEPIPLAPKVVPPKPANEHSSKQSQEQSPPEQQVQTADGQPSIISGEPSSQPLVNIPSEQTVPSQDSVSPTQPQPKPEPETAHAEGNTKK